MLQSVRIEPTPASWLSLCSAPRDGRYLGRAPQQWREITQRELLGKAFERVLGTGHQAGFWHPGILAKYLALDAAGQALHADALVELLVDQDEHDLRPIRVPAIDAENVLIDREVRWTHWPREEEALPTGMQPPMLAEPGSWTLPGGEYLALPRHVDQIRAAGRALVLLRTTQSRAEQFAMAAAVLRGVRFANRDMPAIDRSSGDPWRRRRFLVQASALTGTSLWRALIERLRGNPQAAWETYNAAIAAAPEAGVVPLERRPSGGCEMPCWLITPDGQRHRAFEHDVQRREAVLWPRALLMTGLVRAALCDLFIHGRGGSDYDRITERWFRDWLGCELAPDAMVTATVTLDIEREPGDERDLARARWLMHHLPFNVDRFIDDRGPLEQRQRLLREIEATPRRSPQRRALFEQMRASQRRLAQQHADLIDAARAHLRRAHRRREEAALIEDRTWPFVLHPAPALSELREAIAGAFQVSSRDPES